MRPDRRNLIAVEAIVAVLLIFVVDMTISGYLLFTKAGVDTLQRADAIIVLGGAHDGREDYGLRLAREGWASTVVISNPYGPDDPVMRRVCHDTSDIEVICRRPEPSTTRGEALFTRQLADARSWSKVIVVSWRYHLPRARLVFRQCFSDRPGAAIMTPVPQLFPYSALEWEFVYAYQFGGLAKAIALGECS